MFGGFGEHQIEIASKSLQFATGDGKEIIMKFGANPKAIEYIKGILKKR